MKTMTVKLHTITINAHSKTALIDKLSRSIKYGYSRYCTYYHGSINVKHSDVDVYAINIHKTRVKKARKDYVLKNKLMKKSEVNRYCRLHGIVDKENPMIRYNNTQWTAEVTVIPKVLLELNKQKIIQHDKHWEIVNG